MKKRVQRLVLTKETLRTLTTPRLTLAVGGTTDTIYCYSEYCATINCGTHWCTSNEVACLEEPTLKC